MGRCEYIFYLVIIYIDLLVLPPQIFRLVVHIVNCTVICESAYAIFLGTWMQKNEHFAFQGTKYNLPYSSGFYTSYIFFT